jgi:hypothetical protein
MAAARAPSRGGDGVIQHTAPANGQDQSDEGVDPQALQTVEDNLKLAAATFNEMSAILDGKK